MQETDLKDIYLGAVEKNNLNDVCVYIINTSNESKIIKLLQSSVQGDTEGLLDLGKSSYEDVLIPANGFIKIDHMDDGGQLDFTTSYNIKVGKTEYFESINGHSFDKKPVDIPMLNQKGFFSGFRKVGK
jgi:hypothetical protein